MTPPTPAPAARKSALRTIGWSLLLAALSALAYFGGQRAERDRAEKQAAARLPVVVERPMPSVVLAVQSLARLQSVSFHMERIVDLTKKEQALWGLVETHDNILLVAVGDVQAGVDLGKLQKADVIVDETAKKVRIVLPPAEVFSARLDNERTYVHSRKTDVLGKPDVQLESDARKRAEAAIHQGALDAGILKHAEDSAVNTVRSLVQSLGFAIVIVETKRE
jgi:hypothetical protein